MRISVEPPDGVSWCMQTVVDRGGDTFVPVRTIVLVRIRYKTPYFAWLATSRYHLGWEMYRVFTSHRLDIGDVVECYSADAAEVYLRQLAIEEYRRRPYFERAWAEWRADKEQNATLELLEY